MAIISICSPKGGVGKTTAATLIATTLAERGASVIDIDADPNKSVVDWARLPGVPANLKVLESTDENEIVRMIDASAAEADFVIVDLEGRASPIVGHAIAMSNFVIIPVRGSNLDAKQAARQMAMIKTQERLTGRVIPVRRPLHLHQSGATAKDAALHRDLICRGGCPNLLDAALRPRGVPGDLLLRRSALWPQGAPREQRPVCDCERASP